MVAKENIKAMSSEAKYALGNKQHRTEVILRQLETMLSAVATSSPLVAGPPIARAIPHSVLGAAKGHGWCGAAGGRGKCPPPRTSEHMARCLRSQKKNIWRGACSHKKNEGEGRDGEPNTEGGQIKSLLEENFTPLYPNLASQINIPKLLNLLLGHQLYKTSIVLLEW